MTTPAKPNKPAVPRAPQAAAEEAELLTAAEDLIEGDTEEAQVKPATTARAEPEVPVLSAEDQIKSDALIVLDRVMSETVREIARSGGGGRTQSFAGVLVNLSEAKSIIQQR
jgi:hypothetical protein